MCLKSGDPGFDGKQLHFEVDKERQTGTYQEASGGNHGNAQQLESMARLYKMQ